MSITPIYLSLQLYLLLCLCIYKYGLGGTNISLASTDAGTDAGTLKML